MSFISPQNLKLTGYTLVIPIVSTANVAQLAVDLLISSLSLQRMAVIDPAYFIPVVGPRDDGHIGITTPLELYGHDDSSLIVLQQRSPVLKSKKQDFTDALLAFVQTSGISSVLLLSGMEVSNRSDSQMRTPIYHIPAPKSPRLGELPLKNLATLGIPVYSSPAAQDPQLQSDEPLVPFIPGGGLTRRILASLPDTWNIPTAALLQFVLEGDNREDAHLLAASIARILDVKISQLREPTSWQGLFGAPHDQSLYG